MVTITLSETYDLSTKVGKMTLIGIHTPTRDLIKRTYPGLAMNHKFFHIDHVSVRLASVSTLPVSPDQVGADTNDIAPEDMLNPILYKAVTNESWSTLEARLNGLRAQTESAIGSMLDYSKENVTNLADEFNVYYSLLSNRQGFKIAHPQQGLAMNRLVPLVFDKWYSNGQNETNADTIEGDPAEGPIDYPEQEGASAIIATSNSISRVPAPQFTMRGRPHKMPRINTTFITSASGLTPTRDDRETGFDFDGANYMPLSAQANMPDIPPLYCGLIVMPPARRTIMFYRLVCSCQITFSGVRPLQDIMNFQTMSERYGPYVYHSDYVRQSKAMAKTTDLVDVDGADIKKIMEG